MILWLCDVLKPSELRKYNRKLLFFRLASVNKHFSSFTSFALIGMAHRIINPDVVLLLYIRFDELPRLTNFCLYRFLFSLSLKCVCCYLEIRIVVSRISQAVFFGDGSRRDSHFTCLFTGHCGCSIARDTLIRFVLSNVYQREPWRPQGTFLILRKGGEGGVGLWR